MNVLIAYDTNYGTTETVAEWLAEGINADCRLKRIEDADYFDYDLIVIGTSIYVDEPLTSVLEFLDDKREVLTQRNVAFFIVYDKLLTKKIEHYIGTLRDHGPETIIDIGIFGGYSDINRLSDYDRATIEDSFTRLGKRYEILDNRDKEEVMAFGRRLRRRIEG